MRKVTWVLAFLASSLGMVAQNVGIGTTNPLARLHVEDSSVVFSASGSSNSNTAGNPPITGAGRRMMWYAGKGAFRAGFVTGDEWNKSNVGAYSVATGYSTTASGTTSTAMGGETIASEHFSTALGYRTIASGAKSIAMGDNTDATGEVSFAMGFFAKATGINSTAIGRFTTASGNYSTAIGNFVSTNGLEGCLIIGDYSTALPDNNGGLLMSSITANSFRARFAGGYRFYTSSNLTSNALLAPGDNAWSTSSNVHLKENFQPLDGESFLQKIGRMNLVSWNYKGQNPKTFRHYGPMAQEFYSAFGRDSYGTIGTDTTINQADFDGVNLIAIQALVSRTTSQQLLIDSQQKEIAELNNRNQALEARLQKLEKFMAVKK